ncbi:MAG: response regulator [Thermoguttaceae bacterium]
MIEEPMVFIVVDAPAARRNLVARLKTMRLPAAACHSTEELLDLYDPAKPGCLLLGIAPPEHDLKFLERLSRQEPLLPVIVLAVKAEVPIAVRAMKLGAMDFLQEPCADEQLGLALQAAFEWHITHRQRINRIAQIRRRFARLTPPQRDVLELLLVGKSNREIAAELDRSVRCIEDRRSKLMSTVRAKSLPDLVRLVLHAETE